MVTFEEVLVVRLRGQKQGVLRGMEVRCMCVSNVNLGLGRVHTLTPFRQERFYTRADLRSESWRDNGRAVSADTAALLTAASTL